MLFRSQVRAWIVSLRQTVQIMPQKPEPLEEDLTDKPGLIPEQLVYSRRRRRSLFRDPAGRKTANAFALERIDRSAQQAVT